MVCRESCGQGDVWNLLRPVHNENVAPLVQRAGEKGPLKVLQYKAFSFKIIFTYQTSSIIRVIAVCGEHHKFIICKNNIWMSFYKIQ